MKQDGEINKILFLCFPFISDWFSYDFIKTEYNKLLKDFGIKDGYAFERVCAEFQDKIELGDYVRFSHPSYSEALPFILVDEHGVPTNINIEFFSIVLINLVDNEDAAWKVADAVARNFDNLPEKVQNLLFKLADNEDAAWKVASAVSQNFDKLPENVRNELLFKLSKSNKASGYVTSAHVAYAIASNFDKLPESVRNKLLFKLAENKDAAYNVARGVATNFDKLPENIQNLLFKLAKNEEGIKGGLRG